MLGPRRSSLSRAQYFLGAILLAAFVGIVALTYLRIEQQLQETLEQRLRARGDNDAEPAARAYRSVQGLRQSYATLIALVCLALLGLLALLRWTLRVRRDSVLMTQRLTRLGRAIQPLSAALEHDPNAVVLADEQGEVVYANAASQRMLSQGTPLLGRHVQGVFSQLSDELRSALSSGRDSIVTQSGSGAEETLLVSGRSLGIEGSPHYLYLLRPVTAQVRRQEVENWKKLIRVLSHELNNALAPITSLLSSARQLNKMKHQDPRLGDIFEGISERTSHLLSFLDGYREIARLPRPSMKEVAWDNFIESVASEKKFRLVGTLPERNGTFDPIQMQRVLSHLLRNAHESGSPGEDIEVQVSEGERGFRINVLDRGCGMTDAILKQAMLPFFSTKRTGTGVGLALSREIIEAHGGQLSMTNRDQGGLSVSCFLPDDRLRLLNVPLDDPGDQIGA